MNWFMAALKNYAVFSGRSRRSEYWYFALFYLIFYAVCAIVDGITGSFDRASGIGIFTGILTLALLIPSLSVSVRRLHDTGRSGWWLLIGLIPLVGLIILLVFFAQDSEARANPVWREPEGSRLWPFHRGARARQAVGCASAETLGSRGARSASAPSSSAHSWSGLSCGRFPWRMPVRRSMGERSR